MSMWNSPVLATTFLGSTLPPHCAPENEFLRGASEILNTCLPTPLAFISNLCGTLSIVSWLFAQLPQIYKNQKLRSTSGLSFFFLVIWLLGDLSNLLGCLFTEQALWQAIIAGYYVSVDCILVGQWIWFEKLRHGRTLLRVRSPRRGDANSDADDRHPDRTRIFQTLDSYKASLSGEHRGSEASKPIHQSLPVDILQRAESGISAASSSEASYGGQTLTNTPTGRPTVQRHIRFGPASASPQAMLYIALVLAVVVRANPVVPPAFTHPKYNSPAVSDEFSVTSSGYFSSPRATAGTIVSWLSTVLYLGSRLPQLLKNQRRRSTAGLSPTLFVAAFFGNLFYSSSLLTNPCAWYSFDPYGGGGWVGESGSVRSEWVAKAAPFWLGAAGVLALDGAVGVQFLVFGDGQDGAAKAARQTGEVLIMQGGRAKGWKWERVSGWMRGWAPSAGRISKRSPTSRESEALLDASSTPESYGTS